MSSRALSRALRLRPWLFACAALLLVATPVGALELSGMVARLETQTNGDGSMIVRMLAGGPLGLGGAAAGTVVQGAGSSDPTIWLAGTDAVSGIDPNPFFPAGEGDVSGIDPDPFAPADQPAIGFSFDSAGAYSGVDPTPFKLFLATPGGILGELRFEHASVGLGSLILTDVRIDTGVGTVTIPTFRIEALPTLDLSGMVARLETQTNGDGSMIVRMLAGGPLGLGGAAAGTVVQGAGSSDPTIWLAGTDAVSGVDPNPFFPVGEGDVSGVDPDPFAPADQPAIGFSFDSAGAYSGIDPTPFKLFLATPGGILGELRFEDASAGLGSLILTDVRVDVGPANVTLPTFTIQGLPAAPSASSPVRLALALLLAAAGGLALRRRRPR